MKTPISIILLLFSCQASAAGDSWPPVDTPKSTVVVQVRVEYIEVPHEAFTRLMFLKTAGADDASPMRKTLQEMVAKDEAKVVETMLLACQSGSRATVESARELIYPTEFSIPTFPGSPSPPKTGPESIFPQPPTAFDIRNCGTTMEIEPNLSEDGKSVQLRVIPEVVTHSGNKIVQEGKCPLGNPVTILMPDFHAARIHVTLSCPAGQYVLAGILSPAGADGKTDMARKILVMARCDVVKAD